MVYQTYANWYPGFLIYVGVIVQHQPWRTLALLHYLDIIHKAYMESDRPLRIGEFLLSLNKAQITLHPSKMDQLSKGTQIVLGLCFETVAALYCYLVYRGTAEGNLFLHQDGTPLTRYQFWTLTKKALT